MSFLFVVIFTHCQNQLTADSHAEKDPISIHKDTEFDISKLPKPDVIPEDSADSFVIDVGTYVPAENHLYTNVVRSRVRHDKKMTSNNDYDNTCYVTRQ